EDVAAEQGQGLGQLGVFLLQLVVVRRSLRQHAFEFVDAAPGGLGLLPQLIVAAQQVIEQPPAFRRIIGEVVQDAHNMNYTRSFMLCKSTAKNFTRFLGPQPARWNRLRCGAVCRSIPERSMASCAGWSSTPSAAPPWGSWKEPASRRLYQMARPSRSK